VGEASPQSIRTAKMKQVLLGALLWQEEPHQDLHQDLGVRIPTPKRQCNTTLTLVTHHDMIRTPVGNMTLMEEHPVVREATHQLQATHRRQVMAATQRQAIVMTTHRRRCQALHRPVMERPHHLVTMTSAVGLATMATMAATVLTGRRLVMVRRRRRLVMVRRPVAMGHRQVTLLAIQGHLAMGTRMAHHRQTMARLAATPAKIVTATSGTGVAAGAKEVAANVAATVAAKMEESAEMVAVMVMRRTRGVAAQAVRRAAKRGRATMMVWMRRMMTGPSQISILKMC